MSGLQRVQSATGAASFADLSLTPWRRVMLSAKHNIWCLVDAEDYPWIAENNWNWGWHAKTPWKHYAKRNVGEARSTVYLHREILMRADPRDLEFYAAHHGHHNNGCSLDNRRKNLGWLAPAKNSSIRVPRLQAWSVEAVLASLLQSLPAIEGVPFDGFAQEAAA